MFKRVAGLGVGGHNGFSARRVVLALVIVSIAWWPLAAVGVGGPLPSPWWIPFGVGLEAALLVGLWVFWRTAWWVAVIAGTEGAVVAGAGLARNWSAGGVVVLILGLAYLTLLMHPELRIALRPLRRLSPRQKGRRWLDGAPMIMDAAPAREQNRPAAGVTRRR